MTQKLPIPVINLVADLRVHPPYLSIRLTCPSALRVYQLPPCDSGDVRAHVQYGAAIFTPLSYEGKRALRVQPLLRIVL